MEGIAALTRDTVIRAFCYDFVWSDASMCFEEQAKIIGELGKPARDNYSPRHDGLGLWPDVRIAGTSARLLDSSFCRIPESMLGLFSEFWEARGRATLFSMFPK